MALEAARPGQGVSGRALIVLGGRVGGGALVRRIGAAVDAARRDPSAWIVACGGRRWDGVVEADAILEGLVESGIAPTRVFRDRLSLTTVENLIEARAVLARIGARDARWTIVTCGFHLPRSLAIAAVLGVEAEGFPAPAPPRSGLEEGVRALRERALTLVDRHLARGAS